MQLYTPGKWAAGTPQDDADRRAAAFSCFVFRMRRHGARLPARHVADPEPGELLCFDWYGEPDRFMARLFHAGQLTDWGMEMHGARLEREGPGVRLLRGDEWDPNRKEHTLQTWLCTDTAERGWKILSTMAAREAR